MVSPGDSDGNLMQLAGTHTLSLTLYPLDSLGLGTAQYVGIWNWRGRWLGRKDGGLTARGLPAAEMGLRQQLHGSGEGTEGAKWWCIWRQEAWKDKARHREDQEQGMLVSKMGKDVVDEKENVKKKEGREWVHDRHL